MDPLPQRASSWVPGTNRGQNCHLGGAVNHPDASRRSGLHTYAVSPGGSLVKGASPWPAGHCFGGLHEIGLQGWWYHADSGFLRIVYTDGSPVNTCRVPAHRGAALLQCSDFSAAPGISQAPPTSRLPPADTWHFLPGRPSPHSSYRSLLRHHLLRGAFPDHSRYSHPFLFPLQDCVSGAGAGGTQALG